MTITQQEIIEMAIDAGFTVSKFDGQIGGFDVDLFELARAIYNCGVRDEREAAAKVCETAEVPIDIEIWMGTKKSLSAATAAGLAAAIRARTKDAK